MMCPYHGHDKLGCPGCRKEAQDFSKRNDHGVFVWRGDGKYVPEAALKVYKNQSAAEKFAEKLNEINPVHVVRTVLRKKEA